MPVLFRQILESAYLALPIKDPGTFYLVLTDEGCDIYLGDQKLNNLAEIIAEMSKLAKIATTGEAIDVGIEDSNNLFEATNVEDALVELRTIVNGLNHIVNVNVQGTALEFLDSQGDPVLIQLSDTSTTDIYLLAA